MNIKLAFENDIHRVPQRPKNLDELRSIALRTFPERIGEEFVLIYLRPALDGGSTEKAISIENDMDFQNCVSYYNQCKKKIIKFEIKKFLRPPSLASWDFFEKEKTKQITGRMAINNLKRGREVSFSGIYNELLQFSSLWVLALPCYKCSGGELSCAKCNSQCHIKRKKKDLNLILRIFEQKLKLKFPTLTKKEISPILRICEHLLLGRDLHLDIIKGCLRQIIPAEEISDIDHLDDLYPKRRRSQFKIIVEEDSFEADCAYVGLKKEFFKTSYLSEARSEEQEENAKDDTSNLQDGNSLMLNKCFLSQRKSEGSKHPSTGTSFTGTQLEFIIKYKPQTLILVPGGQACTNLVLKNTGKYAWPLDSKLKCISGIFANDEIQVGNVEPGKDTSLSFILKAPSIEGIYRSFWTLISSRIKRTPLVNLISNNFTLEIIVRCIL